MLAANAVWARSARGYLDDVVVRGMQRPEAGLKGGKDGQHAKERAARGGRRVDVLLDNLQNPDRALTYSPTSLRTPAAAPSNERHAFDVVARSTGTGQGRRQAGSKRSRMIAPPRNPWRRPFVAQIGLRRHIENERVARSAGAALSCSLQTVRRSPRGVDRSAER